MKDQLGMNFEIGDIETVAETKARKKEEMEAEKKLTEKREKLKSKLQELSKFDFSLLDKEIVLDDVKNSNEENEDEDDEL